MSTPENFDARGGDESAVEYDKSLIDPRNHDTPDNMTRRQSAVNYKIAGASYTTIAEQLGYASPASARRAIERAIADATASPEDREHVRWLLDQRLERLHAAVGPKAFREGPQQLDYIAAQLRIMDRKMALWGLASANLTITPAPERVNELIQMLTEASNAGAAHEADIMDAEIVPEEIAEREAV